MTTLGFVVSIYLSIVDLRLLAAVLDQDAELRAVDKVSFFLL